MVTAGIIGGPSQSSSQLRDSTELFTDGSWNLIPKKLPEPINACVAINIDNKVLLFGKQNIFKFSNVYIHKHFRWCRFYFSL